MSSDRKKTPPDKRFYSAFATLLALSALVAIFLQSRSRQPTITDTSPAIEDAPCDCPSHSFAPIPRATPEPRPRNPHNYDDTLLIVAERLQADTVELQRIPLIDALDEHLQLTLGEHSLRLNRESVRGENFQVLIQDDTGAFRKIDPGPVRTYTGDVLNLPEASVSAYLGTRGVHARITDPNTIDQFIAPLTPEESALLSSTIPGDGVLHAFYRPLLDENTGAETPSFFDKDGLEIAALGIDGQLGTAPGGGPAPRIVGNVCVRESEVGFDVSWRFYSERNGSSTATVMTTLEDWLANTMNPVFTRDCLIKLVMGTVVIRTSQAQDPYNGNTNANDILSDFRGIWNTAGFPGALGGASITGPNPSTHDHAFLSLNGSVGVTGLSYVGQVGNNSRYSLATAKSGMGFWRNGGRHEIGHIWSLSHGDGCKTEPNAGGGETDSGIICGGYHERANSVEVGKILAHRNSRTAILPEVGLASNLAPYCVIDRVNATDGTAPFAIDVLANDFDANNDNFTISRISLNAVHTEQATPTAVATSLGGSVIRSVGTGPNARDELLYTPPVNGSGEDKFHYYAKDIGGKSNWGYVVVSLGRLFEENFDYAASDLAGNVNDGVAWVDNNGATAVAVTPGSLPVPSPEGFATSGGRASQIGSDRHSIALSGSASGGANGTTRYISFVQKFSDSSSTNTKIVEFWNGSASDANTAFSFGTDGNPAAPDYGLLIDKLGGNVPLDVGTPDTDPHLIVLKVTYGSADNDSIDVFVDPGVVEPLSPNASAAFTNLAFDRLGFGAFQGGAQEIDSIRIGRSWADAVPIQDGLYFEESFSYPAGDLIGNSNAGNTWDNNNGGGTTTVQATSIPLAAPADFVTSGGSALQSDNRHSLELPASAHGGEDESTVYISFLQRFVEGSETKTKLIEFWNGPASDSDTAFALGTDTHPSAPDYGMLIDKNGANLALDLGDADTDIHLVVLKLDYGLADADTISVFLDPGATEPLTADASTSSTDLAFNRIGFGTFQGGSQEIDEIRIGRSYADVVPIDTGLYFQESLSHPSGVLAGNPNDGFGWTANTEGGGSFATVQATSITLPNFPGFASEGGSITQAASNRHSLQLSPDASGGTDDTTIYIAFIQKFGDPDPNKTRILEFWNGTVSDTNTAFSFGTDTTTAAPDYGLLIDKLGANIPLDVGTPDSDPHLIVLKIDYGPADADTISVFVDPGEIEPATPDATTNFTNLAFNRLGLGTFQGGTQEIDEIRIGDRYSSVVPITTTDGDSDGLPDEYERNTFGDLSKDGTADTDGDGQNDLHEFIAGTNPLDANSVFTFSPPGILRTGPSQLTLSWHSISGRTYSIWSSDTLSPDDWDPVEENILATGPLTTRPVTTAGPILLYQIRVSE